MRALPIRAAWILLAALVAHRSTARASDAGICARCHDTEAALAVLVGGHATGIDCITCHDDRRPGVFGHGHRAVPTSCTSHHDAPVETHPPPARRLAPVRQRRRCLRCHDPHGSENAHLVRTALLVRGRFRQIDFHAAAGDPLPFVDPARPGRGLCETCHRSTKFYLASGRGQPHYTGDCTACHDHGAGFRPVVSDANCAICHADEAALLAKPTLHHANFSGRCSSCHAEAKPDPGPGHRAVATCTDCHSAARVTTHVPPGVAIPCMQCHEPHGTDNIRLLRDVLHTPQGADRPLVFTNLAGRADGSFASVSAPGTGLCETCHTQTQFYRADGSGAPHYTSQCIVCHRHVSGFLPS